ncbi:hypothetical protein F0250_19335 [Vibrio cyclitrophicus]|uniref:hypothetical protein n=1 Tax=Vibrio cyclitrophicus TaxID=47951 RepID=UPI00148C9DF6|nr:hypothetical protein [Vibrio cyclitrophicus]NOI36074.1 hypothetical protein [Vibrio cyclitrophicus]
MDRAYNKVTNEILYAYQVKRQGDEFVTRHRSNFECPNPYCNGIAEPIACLSMRQISATKFQPYKQPAHFRIRNHIPNCIFSEEYGGKGVTDKNGNYSWVLPYVTEITLPTNKQKFDRQCKNTTSLTTLPKADTSPSDSNGASSPSGRKTQRSSYVSAAAFYYIQDPEQAKEKDLTILGYTRTYQHFFQELGWYKDSRYIDNHIFYKPLKFTQEPIVKDGLIVLTLYQIEPQSRKQFELHLNTADWTSRDKEACLSEIRIAIDAAKNKSAFTTVFFIGCQDRNQQYVFHCDYSEFFSIYVGEKFLLPNNHRGVKRIQPQAEIQDEPATGDKELNHSLLCEGFQGQSNHSGSPISASSFDSVIKTQPEVDFVQTETEFVQLRETAASEVVSMGNDIEKKQNAPVTGKMVLESSSVHNDTCHVTKATSSEIIQKGEGIENRERKAHVSAKRSVLSTLKFKLKSMLGL